MALANMQRGNIAPVDLAQAAIGPGMAVYTRYAKVLDAEGKDRTRNNFPECFGMISRAAGLGPGWKKLEALR
jgi:hypothetical protein